MLGETSRDLAVSVCGDGSGRPSVDSGFVLVCLGVSREPLASELAAVSWGRAGEGGELGNVVAIGATEDTLGCELCLWSF